MSARYVPRGRNGRRPQNIHKVPFQQVWGLELKNKLSMRDDRVSETACLTETLAFLTCLKNSDNLQSACVMQAQAVEKCYANYLNEKADLKKKKAAAGDFIPGKKVTDMTKGEMNRFLQHFPHKLPSKK